MIYNHQIKMCDDRTAAKKVQLGNENQSHCNHTENMNVGLDLCMGNMHMELYSHQKKCRVHIVCINCRIL